jgi:hypothetical protein
VRGPGWWGAGCRCAAAPGLRRRRGRAAGPRWRRRWRRTRTTRPRSARSSEALAWMRPDGVAGLLEGGGLADQVGQAGLAAGEQHRHPAGVGGREIEVAVAVGSRRPEQGVAAADLRQLPGPAGDRLRNTHRVRLTSGPACASAAGRGVPRRGSAESGVNRGCRAYAAMPGRIRERVARASPRVQRRPLCPAAPLASSHGSGHEGLPVPESLSRLCPSRDELAVGAPALVAQGIEHRSPKAGVAQFESAPGAPPPGVAVDTRFAAQDRVPRHHRGSPERSRSI